MIGRLLCWVRLHAWRRVGIRRMPVGVLHYEACRRDGCDRARMRGEGC
ncbi:hypothetical protein LCGC14_1411150 [marine sediment metagenome]|uniref:Uncharacterized protein n=1 Tax=marine sediment metagenome TaxID=412755 RepID=A0A0F9MVY3_9ZZZZ